MSYKMNPELSKFAREQSYLLKEVALVQFVETKNIFETPDKDPSAFTHKNKEYRGVVYWGSDNNFPQDLMDKCYVSPVIASNHFFNTSSGYGEGITPVRYKINDQGKRSIVPVYDNADINDFFENNDINRYFLEQLTDLNHFHITFPELILNRETPDKRKVVELNHKEAVFSRFEEANPDTGLIDHHFYSAKWDESDQPEEKDLEITACLSSRNAILELKRRIGREQGLDGKKRDEKVYRYVMPIRIPTPGRVYYPKAPYYSIFEGKWYDYAIQIPVFKKALLENAATIKYVVYLTEDYFENIFQEEGITTDEKKKARITKEYTNINDYLTGAKNAGKSVISKKKTGPDGKDIKMIEIEVIDNKLKGGEYIEDSEEASNIMSYAMSVHPSMIGASPGKSKNINGTEARELFNIKQALMRPIRDQLLKPLYVIKAINKWPADIFFHVPAIQFTTLDENKTGFKNEINTQE